MSGILDADVNHYIDGVLDGSIVTCRYVKLAVRRHVNDLKHGHKRGLHFDEAAAQHIIDFFQFCRHYKGEWAGQVIQLEPWQKFRLACIFGWKKADGNRRFRTAYNEVARKNGKSTEAAPIGLYGLIGDDEPGAEIYTTATKMDQAKIIHLAAIKMVKKSPDMSKILEIYVNDIAYDATDSFFRPLGADAKTMDGLNSHLSLYDELHAHRDSSIWDIINSSNGSRRQPLNYIITTAGFNKASFCHGKRKYAINVLEGHIEDDSFFAIIYTLDEGDNWKDEKVWPKANPNLGICKYWEHMREACKVAINDPGEQNNFLVKELNIWTSQYIKYIPMDKWDACTQTVDFTTMANKPTWEGLDLSSKIDIAAYVRIFDVVINGENYVALLPKFYLPGETARERSKKDGVDYLKWAEQGYINLTPGNVIDYEFIKNDIKESYKNFDVQATGFDPWNCEMLRQDLIKDGLSEKKLIEYRPTLQNMTGPTKEINSLIISGRLIHNNNPVLRWMADNLAVYTDPNENVRPQKDKSSEKIDGIVAAISALGIKMTQPQAKDSVYEDRGIISV